MTYRFRAAVGLGEYPNLKTNELRDAFLVEKLFNQEGVDLYYWETDRAVIGSVVPLAAPLKLQTFEHLDSTEFCQRREVGVINLGGPGSALVDGISYDLERLDCLYVGRGSSGISFRSIEPRQPARFFLISYPAHAPYPTMLIRRNQARELSLGAHETSNVRRIYQYIHEDGVKSCQLVLGITILEPGNVWNTMPPHTHRRRSEVYCYFDLPETCAVFHLMGTPDETRHLTVRNGQAVLSPAWSIHSGCGTGSYSFIWAMGGENQRFGDMDAISIPNLY
jgi:4-deoxy-L-threo-5-hexosulose-uronate ketol-isomerase